MPPPIATPRSRALGFGLRKARTARGYGVRELARAADVHPADLSNWELGSRVPKVEEVAVLLGQLRVPAEERKRLLELAGHAREPNWLEKEMPNAPAILTTLAEYERTAASIFSWQPMVVHGLLQTPDYARAILAYGGSPTHLVEQRMRVRMIRQAALREHPAPECSILLGEIALRQRIGGTETLIGQLRHLLDLPRRLAVRVVRFGGDFHPGLNGSFSVFEYSDLPAIVFLDQHRGSAYIYDDDQVADYKSAAKTVASLALDAAGSRAFIEGVIAELEA
ncbi:helix-turn-helix transcriptional regulator [Amycolatopsis mongoliensis]|uniref:Helix-turn-helix transcriptional regulator n=1 Tax=Amycolatopsis mongoliensis TaxID=715475 RepID=A0A9Y2JVC4_9PSEU|nr:helix-turn-helix transcriptional regulator [Amycolatopsis sp. 4-36]WIY04630.1 helix-turn-helix transcriptional regulator [Amycolatopsis sp. 4-36]